MIGKNDQPSRGVCHCSLDLRLRDVGGGHTGFDGQPIGTHHSDVRPDGRQRVDRPRPDGHERSATDVAANEVQVDIGTRGYQGGHRECVGDHGEFAVGGEHSGQPCGGGTSVDDQRARIGDLSQRSPGDRRLGVGVRTLAFLKALFDRDPLDGNRAAMNSPQDAATLECGQVAPDGFGGDIQLLGQAGDVDPTVAARPRSDRCLAFRCVHAQPLPFGTRDPLMAPAGALFIFAQPGLSR